MFGRERAKICDFFIERAALGGEFVVVFDDFAQHARQEAERELAERAETIDREFACFGRIAFETVCFELTGKHVVDFDMKSYTSKAAARRRTSYALAPLIIGAPGSACLAPALERSRGLRRLFELNLWGRAGGR